MGLLFYSLTITQAQYAVECRKTNHSKLHDNGQVAKTELATKYNIIYDKLIMCLDWLVFIDVIDRNNEQESKSKTIKLSEYGFRFCDVKLSSDYFI